jgi:hypothetical protein
VRVSESDLDTGVNRARTLVFFGSAICHSARISSGVADVFLGIFYMAYIWSHRNNQQSGKPFYLYNRQSVIHCVILLLDPASEC